MNIKKLIIFTFMIFTFNANAMNFDNDFELDFSCNRTFRNIMSNAIKGVSNSNFGLFFKTLSPWSKFEAKNQDNNKKFMCIITGRSSKNKNNLPIKSAINNIIDRTKKTGNKFAAVPNKMLNKVDKMGKGIIDHIDQKGDGLSKKVAENIEQSVKNVIHEMNSNGDDLSKKVSETVKKASKEVIRDINSNGDDLSKKVVETVKKASKEVIRDINSNGDDLSKKVAKNIEQSAKDVSDKLKADIQDVSDDVNKKINDVVNNVGSSLERNIKIAGLVTVGVTVGTIASWYLFKHVERSMLKSKLVIESSDKGLFNRIKNKFLPEKINFREMIFAKDLEVRLNDIISMTQDVCNGIKNGEKLVYRNLLLYGPPGTGKTMFAKELAKKSRMDWDYISGASFRKFSEAEGIKEMDELFRKARKSKNGYMLIIDEADSFLYSRELMNPSSKEYNLLNNFLSHTGDYSNKFMIVFCANYKEKFDTAIYDRIKEYVSVQLPAETERFRVLDLYKRLALLDQSSEEDNDDIFIKSVNICLSNKKLEKIAKMTDGFSNRELEDIIRSIKAESRLPKYQNVVTFKLVDEIVRKSLEKHKAFKSKNS